MARLPKQRTKEQEIRAAIRECCAEMRAKGIKRTSCFNGGLHGENYSLNARMFQLETELAREVSNATR